MAQKAVKQLAARNAAKLRQLHVASLAVHGLWLALRAVIFRGSLTGRSWLLWVLLSAPALGIELWFERSSRPRYGPDGEVKRAGDDLEAKGLTDYMHDVLYFTWFCVALAAVFGDRAWYLYAVVPAYSGWLAFSTFGSVRKGLAGMAGGAAGDEDGSGQQASGSKRQQKLEKRGGQQVKYR